MTRGILPTPEKVPVTSTSPVYSTVADIRGVGEAIVRITNNTNQTVVVTVQTALGDDYEFSIPNEAGSGFVGASNIGGVSVTGFVNPATAQVTLDAGASTYAHVSGAWAYARIKGVAAGTPAAESTLDIAWSVKHRGD